MRRPDRAGLSSSGWALSTRFARRSICRAPTFATSCCRRTPTRERPQITRLTALERETRLALQAYSQRLEPEEREPFLELRSGIDAYWQVLDRTVAWTPEERKRLRDSFFYDELVPRRTTMLQIADRIAAVNEHGLNRAEEQLAASAVSLRRSLLLTFGITLAGGLRAGAADHRLSRCAWSANWSSAGRERAQPICRSSRRACCAPRKMSAGRWRASCTTKSASRSRPF